MIVTILIPLCVILLMTIVGTGLQMKQFMVPAESPAPLIGGTLLQMLLLPAGLLLVSACPGGALSNYYCHPGKLNVAL